MSSISTRVICTLLLALATPLAWADVSPSAPASAAAQSDASAASAAPASAPETAASASSTPTEPQLVAADKISAGDTAWMLTSTGLVLLMTIPGLALFYGGMVRKKNALATLMQSFACTCVVTLLWWLIGYSWAFTPGNGFIGGTSRALFRGLT